MAVPLLELHDGSKIPQLAFGTGTAWFKEDDQPKRLNTSLIEITKTAIQKGFRHLDCSEMYGTEEEVGVAIQQSGVTREELFITNKVAHGIDDIANALETSLRKLQTWYFDLYLIHVPFFAKSPSDLQQAWKSMEQLKKIGKVRSIGVSNYLRPDLEATLAGACDPPVINQIEYHPYLQRAHDYVPWMRENGVQVASFKGLTPVFRAPDGPLVEPLTRIAKAHQSTELAVAIAWLLQNGVLAVTTTTKAERFDELIDAVQLKLTPAELEEISTVGASYHFRTSWVDRFAPDDRS